MMPLEQRVFADRRRFLTSASSGVGLVALASMLRDEGLLAAEPPIDKPNAASLMDPMAPRQGHFPPKAKACIFIYLEGAPSQLDLFDPKPKLNQLNGQKLPDSMTEKVRFAFIQKESARLLGSNRTFKKHGQCGMDISDFMPNLATCADDIAWIRSMHTEAFNHHPGQLMMNTGVMTFGRPSVGSWLTYGLGSQSKNLPGYVVLTCGRGTSGGASNWSSGFLPSTYAGVRFRSQGEAVLSLNNPPGITPELQRLDLDAIGDLNRHHHSHVADPEVASRIAAYELAFRMQSAAPELIDLSGETKQTLEAYGVGREPKEKAKRNGIDDFHSFATNCLLARRLVERGVRFVNIFHASWDHHSDLDKDLGFNCQMADQPIAALLKDLKARGLLDSTMVVWGSEFGRTPLGENRVGFNGVSGRDHHPFAFTIWAAGGGFKGGSIIGKTDDLGWNVVEDPVHINDFHATLLHLFGFDHQKLTYRFQGRDFRLTDVAGKVVRKIVA